MRKRILFLAALFCTTGGLLLLQKPAFMLFHLSQTADAAWYEWFRVMLHGLTLDMTVAGYITAIPLLMAVVSCWVRISDRAWRRMLRGYLILVSVVTAAIFAADLSLYTYWGFRIDGTILVYLSDPKGAAASVGLWEAVRQIAIFAIYGGVMIWAYMRVARLFCGASVRWRLLGSTTLLVVGGGLLFLAIRGGLSVATANVSKVYFSSNMFLNHAATNPVFSLLSTWGGGADYAGEYPFFDEQTRAAKFEALRGDRSEPLPDSLQLLRTSRPNVVLILLESFGRTVWDAQVDGQMVMPYMQRLKSEGVWFENFFANSFRTDRGEVAVMSGFPAQTRMSIMKLPAKSRNLPSIARSLGREGYATLFSYGGDLNFTNQASYMYATGWQQLFWQKGLAFDAPTSKWGYADDVMGEFFGNQVLELSAGGKPFLAGWLTLSSHEPFEVPFVRFDDKVLNAMAFTDDCIGQMIDRWRNSPAWDNLLLVLVADHAIRYPEDLAYNAVLRHRIPMLWLGGALKGPRTVDEYASQMDLAATLLAQMQIGHSDFAYSKNIFDPRLPKFGYYTFPDGFGVVEASDSVIYDCTSGMVVAGSHPDLLDVGRTLLQTTYVDIDAR